MCGSEDTCVYFPKLEMLLAKQNSQRGLYVCTSSLGVASCLGVGRDVFGVATSPSDHTWLAHRLEYCEAKLCEVVKQ